MRFFLRHTAVALALTIAAAFGATSASAQSNVRILVNDEPVTSYDIAQRTKLMKLFRQPGGEKQAIEDLIDEAIARQQAKRRNMTISDAQVEARFNGVAQQVKLTPDKLTQALRQQGVDADSLRKFFRAQMTWGRLVQAKMRSQIQVKESDVASAISKGEDSAMIKEYMLQQVIFITPKGKNPGSRAGDAEAFRKRFTGCDSSLSIAKTMKGVVVRDIGRRDSTQIQGPAGDSLKATPAGSTTKPSPSENGLEVLAVCSAKDVRSTAAARAELENKVASEAGKEVDKELRAKFRADASVKYL